MFELNDSFSLNQGPRGLSGAPGSHGVKGEKVWTRGVTIYIVPKYIAIQKCNNMYCG